MALDLTSLEKAIDALRRSIDASRRLPESAEADLRETVQAGVIQHFEVAYELCWKFMQRWLRENALPEEADFPRTRKELFRMAARQELISDPLPWFDFGDSRNRTSHTYDGAKALDAFHVARAFLPYALELSSRLAARND